MIKQQLDAVKMMSDRELLYHLYATQAILLGLAIVIGSFLFTWSSFQAIWQWDVREILWYGGGCALVVLAVDFLIMRYAPEHWYDDGGINEKLFRTRSVPHIFVLTALIAFCEELLFRGVIQTHAGLVVASTIFALLHIRYLQKRLLFLAVVSLSFWIGWVYEWTSNLWVTIFAHFLIDFVLALKIRYDYVRSAEVMSDESS
ncbi:hypothetical protein EDD69_101137 [Thermolongibacillus altinsuensis]|uniref:CAAX prenyl protease 2/Lysostaphin resistance protein A-like domain-containing protein n=1 Tax=Thermolongibacillus altinsuensis TaxID=575256 RepID=A0A4R1QST6_9BACL|nr:CPBP family intramembrane glutamic endopeptidase [Thermolongibacillus altinsuensis]TCL53130.1 hypothetical protein EDD69_101137 [Thermolongibacillus altinsuensis]